MPSDWEIILRLFLSALLGGLIGLERQRISWFAGLRTHMLVCMGSALIMIVSKYAFEDIISSQVIVLDPSRVAAQVVSGIGFLGAGTIIFWKNKIRGLTTAASLWTVAAVGLAAGSGLYFAAIITTLLILIVLAVIKPLEKFLSKNNQIKEIKFSSKNNFPLIKLEGILEALNLRSYLTDLQIENDGAKEYIHLMFQHNPSINLLQLIEEIKKIPDFEEIEVIE